MLNGGSAAIPMNVWGSEQPSRVECARLQVLRRERLEAGQGAQRDWARLQLLPWRVRLEPSGDRPRSDNVLYRTAFSQWGPACSESQMRLLRAASPSDFLRSTTLRFHSLRANSAAAGAERRAATLAVADPEWWPRKSASAARTRLCPAMASPFRPHTRGRPREWFARATTCE